MVVVVELPSCKVRVAGVDEIFAKALAGATSYKTEINKTKTTAVENLWC
jgi:hypothetical protein